MLKKVQVVMLIANNTQVDQKNQLFFATHDKDTKYPLRISEQPNSPTSYRKEAIKQHLYFLSDEEINKGDYHIYRGVVRQYPHDTPWGEEGKIIATTDSSLKIDTEIFIVGERYKSLPQPSQSFLEVFVKEYNKGNVIKEVMVEYDEYVNIPREHILTGSDVERECIKHSYWAPKVNSKSNTITIKRIKDSWNREEVESIVHLAWATASAYSNNTNSKDCQSWIEQNI